MAAALPTRLEHFTPGWLTDTLRASGRIGSGTEVNDVTSTVLGAGEGFVGELARLELGYSGPPGPASVVAKIPTTVEENRAAGQLLGVYEREVRMYAEILPGIDVRIPEVILAELEPDPDAADNLARMVKADRLPLWLLRRLLRAERKVTAVPPAVLLLEDLRDAEVGDQVAGCDLARARIAISAAARLHASAWAPRLPQETHWLTGGDVVPRVFHASFLDSRKGFTRMVEPWFSPHSKALISRVRREGLRRIRTFHARTPRCLVHGDYRLDNMFFGPDGEIRAIIDWQVANLGAGLLDVGYFITGSLPPETPEAAVDELLADYHRALVAAGVSDYPLDRIRADYDEALQVLLHRFAGFDTLEFGDDRGQALVETWLRRLDARLARIPA